MITKRGKGTLVAIREDHNIRRDIDQPRLPIFSATARPEFFSDKHFKCQGNKRVLELKTVADIA